MFYYKEIINPLSRRILYLDKIVSVRPIEHKSDNAQNDVLDFFTFLIVRKIKLNH